MAIEKAISNFREKNQLSKKDITATILNDNKAIIRIQGWNMDMMKEAEDTIYFGQCHPNGMFDIFTFQCTTRTSGILEYNEVFSEVFSKTINRK